MTCDKWRPLALKGICECGRRFWQHTEEVKQSATEAWMASRFAERRATEIGRATPSSKAKREKRQEMKDKDKDQSAEFIGQTIPEVAGTVLGLTREK